jgi:cell volume regulation protein A
MVFVGWTRETGVVPAAVAGLLLAMGVPNEDEMVTVLALAIVVTLGLQATTKAWLAERLGLLEHPAMKASEEPDGARPPAPA